MRPFLVTVLLVLSTLAGMTTGGVGLLLAWQCFSGRDHLIALAIALVALSLIGAPLCAWLGVPPTRLGLAQAAPWQQKLGAKGWAAPGWPALPRSDWARVCFARRRRGSQHSLFYSRRTATWCSLAALGFVFALWGKDVYMVKPAEQLARCIPQAELVVMEGLGHMTAIEAPERITELVLRFLHST